MVQKVPNLHAGMHSGVLISDDSLVDVSCFEETKMHSIIEKFRRTGLVPMVARKPVGIDDLPADIPSDYSEAQERILDAAAEAAQAEERKEAKKEEKAEDKKEDKKETPSPSAEGTRA